MAALCNRRTKYGALESTNQAIALAGSPESADYIRNNWLPEIEKWANYARDHSALLLQVTSTNPNEAFHRSLKALGKITKLTIRPKYSLAGIIALIEQCDSSYDVRAQKAAYDWSKKRLSATLGFPWLELFPYQIQLLLLDEIKAAEALAELGKEPSLADDGTCSCRFARCYWLPCRHVILAFEWLALIKEPNWEDYANQFDESGFEIYSTRALIEVEEESRTLAREIEAKLNTSEALDQVRTRFFEVSEFADQLDDEEKDRLLRRWEEEVAQFSQALIGRSLGEWVARAKDPILFLIGSLRFTWLGPNYLASH
jgi:hypothetical protein